MDTLWSVNQESVRVELSPRGEGWLATVGGKTIEVSSFRKGRLLLADGTVFEYAAEWTQPRKQATLTHAGQSLVLQRLGSKQQEQAGAAGAVKAPMNGQVTKLLKRSGDMVDSGEVVLVLEAMKMENEVSAPIEGRLKSVEVEVGQSVTPGQTLFEVESVDS